MSLAFEQVVADWYWVRALQYFTDPLQAYNRYKNLGYILDVVVGVDPDFQYAYKFGGLAIPYDTGRLRWANTEPAISILQRGVQRFPENWELQFNLGFYLLNFRKDTAGAAEHFAAAARIPGAPPYLKVYAPGCSPPEHRRALVFAETMLRTDHSRRKQIEKRIEAVRLEGLCALEDASADFTGRGRWPAPRWTDDSTVSHRLLPGSP